VLGLVHSQDDEERHSGRRSEVLANIRVSLAGMVAEEIWLGESTEGTAGDLSSATHQVVRMLAHTGMGSKLVSMAALQGRGIGDDYETLLSDPELRGEADRILHQCKEEVRELLVGRGDAVEAVCKAVVEKGEITGDEFRQILWQVGAITERPRVLPQLPVVDGAWGSGDTGTWAGGSTGTWGDAGKPMGEPGGGGENSSASGPAAGAIDAPGTGTGGAPRMGTISAPGTGTTDRAELPRRRGAREHRGEDGHGG